MAETKTKKAAKPAKEKPAAKEETPKLDAHKILLYPLATEKSVRLLQSENKLHFAVHHKARKKDIRSAVESLFKVKVMGVNTYMSPKQRKGAYIKLSPENPAVEVATDLGLM